MCTLMCCPRSSADLLAAVAGSWRLHPASFEDVATIVSAAAATLATAVVAAVAAVVSVAAMAIAAVAISVVTSGSGTALGATAETVEDGAGTTAQSDKFRHRSRHDGVDHGAKHAMRLEDCAGDWDVVGGTSAAADSGVIAAAMGAHRLTFFGWLQQHLGVVLVLVLGLRAVAATTANAASAADAATDADAAIARCSPLPSVSRDWAMARASAA